MKQSFFKRLQGHELEFNRLMYPIRYNIIIKSPGYQGMNIIADRDDKGEWNINQTSDMPYWIYEITSDIHETIAYNEQMAVRVNR